MGRVVAVSISMNFWTFDFKIIHFFLFGCTQLRNGPRQNLSFSLQVGRNLLRIVFCIWLAGSVVGLLHVQMAFGLATGKLYSYKSLVWWKFAKWKLPSFSARKSPATIYSRLRRLQKERVKRWNWFLNLVD